MKKIYILPTISFDNIEEENILAGSPGNKTENGAGDNDEEHGQGIGEGGTVPKNEDGPDGDAKQSFFDFEFHIDQ